MDKLKMYVAFTVLGCLMVLAAGWFLLVSPKRSQVAQLETQAAGQVSSNAILSTQLANLKAKAKDLPKQKARLAAVAAKIPDNPALPALIRALSTAADAAGVELVTVTPGPPTAVVATATGAAGAPAAPGAPGSAAAASGLSQIPLTLNLAGGYFQVEQFVANLENLPRSMRITNLTMTPGANPMKPTAAGTPDDGHVLTATVTGTVFMAGAAAPAAVAAPVAPATGTKAPAGTATTSTAPTGTSTVVSGPAPAAGAGAGTAPTSSTQENS